MSHHAAAMRPPQLRTAQLSHEHEVLVVDYFNKKNDEYGKIIIT